MDWVLGNMETIMDIVAKVIAVAAALSAISPSSVDNKIVTMVMKVVDVIGLNVLHAKNK
jgi:hypothetical protein